MRTIREGVPWQQMTSSAPLGQDKTTKRRAHIAAAALPTLLAGGLGLFVLGLSSAGRCSSTTRFGGEPMVIVAADQVPTMPPTPAARRGRRTSRRARAEQSRRYDAPRTGSGETAAAAARAVPRRQQDHHHHRRHQRQAPGRRGPRLAGESAHSAALLDERVSETSRHGPLPKVGADGARPSDVFARPVKAIAGQAERAAHRDRGRRASASAPPPPATPSASCRRR